MNNKKQIGDVLQREQTFLDGGDTYILLLKTPEQRNDDRYTALELILRPSELQKGNWQLRAPIEPTSCPVELEYKLVDHVDINPELDWIDFPSIYTQLRKYVTLQR